MTAMKIRVISWTLKWAVRVYLLCTAWSRLRADVARLQAQTLELDRRASSFNARQFGRRMDGLETAASETLDLIQQLTSVNRETVSWHSGLASRVVALEDADPPGVWLETRLISRLELLEAENSIDHEKHLELAVRVGVAEDAIYELKRGN